MSHASASESDATIRRRYVANLSRLYERNADLARRIDGLPFSLVPPIEQAQDGQPTLRIRADDGKEIFLHSRYRPREEAEQMVATLGEKDAATCLLLGVGLGYHLSALAASARQPVIIAVEPDLALLKACFCLQDLSVLLDSGRLRFLTHDEKHALHAELNACNADFMLGVQIVATAQSKRVRVEFFENVQRLVVEFAGFARMQMMTLLKNARVTFENVVANLPHYLSHTGVETLAQRAAKRPAIVISAGPSLARNLHLLPALRDRAVLIAVQTVYKLLLSVDCPPHFVTSLDFHSVSAEFFRGAEDFSRTALVAEPKAAPQVLDAYGGQVHVLHHRFVDLLLGDLAPPRAGLRAGATVAHLAFYLAQHLGCDPILFVGQDLCFTEDAFYLPGSPIEQIWQPELNRFCTLEVKQWERIVRNRPILRRVSDMHGRPTYTDDLLVTYAEQFQAEFSQARQRVIQASEGGMALRGTDTMPLAEAATRFCTTALPSDLFFVRQSGAVPDRSRVRARLLERVAEFERVEAICVEMLELLASLAGLVEQPREFNRRLVRVDELRAEMNRHDVAYKLMTDVSATADLRRYGADRRIGRPEQETAETARQRLKRDAAFVEELADAARFIRRTLLAASDRLEADPR